ncbi:MAG: DNA adenine methylase [Terriglobales bacterium]
MLNEPAAPFLKWAGGKGQLLKHFDKHYPPQFERYFEPFIGGGAVFFSFAAEHADLSATISDCNAELINCYKVVRDCVDDLIEALKEHKNESAHYYIVRSQDVSRLTKVQRAARLIYLNRTCFNGLYRVNRSGQFNVPFGKYKNPRIVNEENLHMASQVLQRTTILNCPFSEIRNKVAVGDFVYLDPPYQPISTTSNFTGYTAGSFTLKDQEKLAQFVRELDRRGAYFMLSNSDNEQIEELYQRFQIHRVDAARAINCKGNRRGRISELLIRNY